MGSAAEGAKASGAVRVPVGFMIVCEGESGLELDQYWASLRPEQRLEAAILLAQAADRIRDSSS